MTGGEGGPSDGVEDGEAAPRPGNAGQLGQASDGVREVWGAVRRRTCVDRLAGRAPAGVGEHQRGRRGAAAAADRFGQHLGRHVHPDDGPRPPTASEATAGPGRCRSRRRRRRRRRRVSGRPPPSIPGLVVGEPVLPPGRPGPEEAPGVGQAPGIVSSHGRERAPATLASSVPGLRAGRHRPTSAGAARGRSSVGRAAGLQPAGRRFESGRLHRCRTGTAAAPVASPAPCRPVPACRDGFETGKGGGLRGHPPGWPTCSVTTRLAGAAHARRRPDPTRLGTNRRGHRRPGLAAVSLDLRGHGDSEWASNGDYSFTVLRRRLRGGRRPAGPAARSSSGRRSAAWRP